ncbi:MAG: ImmA/IrrE family metallo-endopeptidase, partial [Candidatus Bipolaricaulota bacterium]
YELDQTEGQAVPDELERFARFSGKWEGAYLTRMVDNAIRRDRIRIAFTRLSSTHAGFATLASGEDGHKMRIAVHEDLDAPSRFGVICHELAHIYLGHLGTDRDRWWPSRINLDRNSMEIEAEAVAYLVTSRIGLRGASDSYVSRHLDGEQIPASVSLDSIAKAASRIEDMARHRLEPRRVSLRQGRTA